MTLNLGLPWVSRHSLPSSHLFKTSPNNSSSSALLLLLLSRCSSEISSFKNISFSLSSPSLPHVKNFHARASLDGGEGAGEEILDSGLLDDDMVRRAAAAKDADEALEMIAEKIGRNGGVVGTSDCCSIIATALDRGNAELALSVFDAMRSSFDQGMIEKGSSVERWRWARPDARTYALLVRGLAAALRVSDAMGMIANVSRMGVSPGEEGCDF